MTGRDLLKVSEVPNAKSCAGNLVSNPQLPEHTEEPTAEGERGPSQGQPCLLNM